MSWIKLEKDLLTDPRVMRMARMLSGHLKMATWKHTPGVLLECNGAPLPGETVVLGALSRLWMLADTHLGDDDILPLGPGDIDQLVGIHGFTEICPREWLEVIDLHHVKLPGYHTHNGTIAKQKAVTQKRVERFRKRNPKQLHLGNGKQLPDQTAPDLDQTIVDNPPTPLDIPAAIGRESWDEWVKHRRKRRMPCDPVTLGKQVKLLAAYSLTIQREIIDSSINSGWQGLFAPKGRPVADPDPFANWQPPPDTDNDPH